MVKRILLSFEIALSLVLSAVGSTNSVPATKVVVLSAESPKEASSDGSNAMSADEANVPLDLGFPRSAYEKTEEVGRPRFELVKRRELDRYEGMRVIVGRAKPYFEDRTRGRGRILSSGFFPALDYWGTATVNTNCFDMLEYTSAHRAFVQKKVIAGIPLRCETSDPRVEIHLLEGKDADVLVFSNWTGSRTDVRYAVRTPGGAVGHCGDRRFEAGGFEVLRK